VLDTYYKLKHSNQQFEENFDKLYEEDRAEIWRIIFAKQKPKNEIQPSINKLNAKEFLKMNEWKDLTHDVIMEDLNENDDT